MTEDRDAFLALVRAGLWGKEVRLSQYGAVNYKEVLRVAEEQSVLGLVAAGFEKLTDFSLPLTDKLTLVGKCQMIEQRNVAMNQFVGGLVEKMRKADIYAVLVKGQGIAQCYERPLWRACGDVDFLLSEDNYEKAKRLLLPISHTSGKEFEYNKHQSLTIDSYTIELHGNLRCGLSTRMDAVIDEVQRDVFFGGNVRSWENGKTYIFLPGIDCDVVFVFTHFLKLFYKGGLGLRQICDWCRLLWIFRDEIDVALLESRLREMRLMSEWKAFAAFAVDRLGMPIEAMPLYDSSNRWKSKTKQIEAFVIASGNFGHNRETNHSERSYVSKKTHSMRMRINDSFHHARIFPLDSLRFMPTIMFQGLMSAARGE